MANRTTASPFHPFPCGASANRGPSRIHPPSDRANERTSRIHSRDRPSASFLDPPESPPSCRKSFCARANVKKCVRRHWLAAPDIAHAESFQVNDARSAHDSNRQPWHFPLAHRRIDKIVQRRRLRRCPLRVALRAHGRSRAKHANKHKYPADKAILHRDFSLLIGERGCYHTRRRVHATVKACEYNPSHKLLPSCGFVF